MSAKILVADDSLTIQKVIQITLADQNCQLVQALSEDDAITQSASVKPQIIYLDYSLSDSKDGYNLASLIKKASPQSNIVMMYGTFDSIDESKLMECGAKDKIIKPFDSTRFTEMCNLYSDSDFESLDEVEDTSIPDKIEESVEADSSEEDWEVVTSTGEQLPEKENLPTPASLHDEILDWGVEVPPVIEATTNEIDDIPSVIEEEEIETAISEVDDRFEDLSEFDEKPNSMFVSADALQEVEEEPVEAIVVGTDSDEDIKILEEEIQDETVDATKWKIDESEEDIIPKEEEVRQFDDVDLSDISPDDFWRSDEEGVRSKPAPSIEIDDDDEELPIPQVIEEKIQPQPEVAAVASIDPLLIEKMIEKKVEEYVSKYCKEALEKVAWEIIPDLAENLIKDELQKLAERVSNPE